MARQVLALSVTRWRLNSLRFIDLSLKWPLGGEHLARRYPMIPQQLSLMFIFFAHLVINISDLHV